MQSSVTIDLTKPDALTHESVARLPASASDGTNTQLRVTKEGVAFISTRWGGAENIDDLAFRLESFSEGTDHVGPAAAQDSDWVNRIHKVLKDNWQNRQIRTSTYSDGHRSAASRENIFKPIKNPIPECGRPARDC